MGSRILETQSMIHLLNNLILDHALQFALMERGVGDKDMPLTVEEIRAGISLCSEMLSMKSTRYDSSEYLEE
jgi:hypothetical protein